MKFQSLSNFALNNNELNATKGGKRIDGVNMTAAQLKMLQDAAAKKASTSVTNCTVTKTTMVAGKICIEWRAGVACTTPTV